MIIIPRVLATLLAEADEHHQRALALDFAEHTLEICGDRLGPTLRATCAELLAAAREAVVLGRAHERLGRAYGDFHAVRATPTGGGVSDDASGVALMALFSSTQRLMEAAGLVVRMRPAPPSCADVARDAQAAAGRRRAEDAGDPAGEASVARSARWEEARWQLARVIETVPDPSVFRPGRTDRGEADKST
ncbi:hypothetical protein [Streptomyces sp. NPDC004134]|uniref:hypothetical protein n=1 Tax=Streptomyces sp. NPDC004134 TaxID=3364691 RepID=UPI0036C83155